MTNPRIRWAREWKLVVFLGLKGYMVVDCFHFVALLIHSGVRFLYRENVLKW